MLLCLGLAIKEEENDKEADVRRVEEDAHCRERWDVELEDAAGGIG
jgi:hypothetical protein